MVKAFVLAYCALLCQAIPTESMARPDHLKNSSSEKRGLEERARTNGKVQIGYFTNWGIYDRNFQPGDVIPDTLTHINYAFADTDSEGFIKLSDKYADLDKRFPGDSYDEQGINAYGCLKQMYILKNNNRNIKVLMSIGGWSYSQDGHFNFITNPQYRQNFVDSAVAFVEDFGLDGIDVDYEYPSNNAQGRGLTEMLILLREAFTRLQREKGEKTPYLITAAVAAGLDGSRFLNVPELDKVLDFWNIMNYDYSGSWSSVVSHQANLYGGNFSNHESIQSYIERGASRSKIVMGIPVYGKGFTNTDGLGQPFRGVGQGSYGGGFWNYRDLPRRGSVIVEDFDKGASWSMDFNRREFISFDTDRIVAKKARYIMDNDLAGGMYWELSGDKVGGESLIGVAARIFGKLDTTPNHLSFPGSRYRNIASGMPGNPPPAEDINPPPPPRNDCEGVDAWRSEAIYLGGERAISEDRLWEARWWTQGEQPGRAGDVWGDNGACSS